MNPRDPEPLWLEEKDWLCTLEFLSRKDATTRASDAEDLGYLLGYAQLTDTRVLALVGDRGDEVYEILFSFSSPERKWQFLELVRSNEDMGDWYVRDEFLVPMTAEIQNAKPITVVLPPDVLEHPLLIATMLVAGARSPRSAQAHWLELGFRNNFVIRRQVCCHRAKILSRSEA